jgi:pyruvate-ferredoxin/flavodoxin oxidoreductase
MSQPASCSSPCGLFDHEYFSDMAATPFKDGTISEAPVMPGTGLFMPPGSAGAKDKGLFRRTVPIFDPELCTGCMECSLVCPDAAIPNAVHEIHELLGTGIAELDITESQREAMRGQIIPMSEGIRDAYRQTKTARDFHAIVAEVADKLLGRQASLHANFTKLVDVLASFPVARTRPFFDAMEKTAAGTGGLFSATIDPWKCTGCLECIAVCGPRALKAQEQDAATLEMVQARFDFMTKLPNTAERFYENATSADGEAKRLLLDRGNYYSTTGGHGGCRGCGEVTAIRQVMATNHAITDKRKHAHMLELEGLLEALEAKKAALGNEDAARSQRIADTIQTLEKRLYLYEGGPTGNGPAGAVIANSTGCSSVYASTFPYNAYKDPWVNSLFQDAQPLAKGIFEGLAAQALFDIRALRTAKLELADAYVPEKHDAEMRLLNADRFTKEELALLPTIMTVGGDGATYDIGFGALSRILASNTPIKVVVLNTGAYSNTGGQASTSSYIGQDADLSRFGAAHSGKYEARKELGLIASFHSNVFVCSTATALQGHFLKNTMEFLTYSGSPAVLDIYTPCQGEHGVADNVSAQQARLAVESRMSPVFVHDPRRGKNLHDWFSLEGNPDPLQSWTNQTIEYLDDNNQLQLLSVPLTPANFALTEIRFKKQFRKLKADATDLVPIHEFIDLPEAQRAGKTPFIFSTDAKKKLVKIGVSASIVALVEERRKNWTLLQYLDGQHVSKMSAEYKAGIAALQAQVQDTLKQRDASLDGIARSMAQLAASTKAQAGSNLIPIVQVGGSPAAAPAAASPAAAGAGAFVTLEDSAKCTNCKTCYQDVPEVFEVTKMVIDGESREVARIIPGVLDRIEATPELKARIQRVSANCDAEIIQ